MQFPVQHAEGRFYIASGHEAESPPMHIRTSKESIHVFVSADAYYGVINAGNAKVCGLECVPPPGLIATLLLLPQTTARVHRCEIKTEEQTHTLEVSCWDASGMELRLEVGLRTVNAATVVPDALESALNALGALESVVASLEAERSAGKRGTAAPGSLDEITRAALVKGRPIDRNTTWRRAVQLGATASGNRAYGVAHRAQSLAAEIAAEKAEHARKIATAKKVKLEHRAYYEGRAEGAASKPPTSTKQEVIFVDSDEEEPPTLPKKQPDELAKVEPKTEPEEKLNTTQAETEINKEDNEVEVKANKATRKGKKRKKGRRLV